MINFSFCIFPLEFQLISFFISNSFTFSVEILNLVVCLLENFGHKVCV